jgi:hypothetical protein
MSVQTKSIPIVTSAGGAVSVTVRGGCILRKVRVELGTLTTPDITITDEPSGDEILVVAGLATDESYLPARPAHDDAGAEIEGSATPWVIETRLLIAIAGGGASKTGEITLVYER